MSASATPPAKGLCHSCQALVSTHLETRDVLLSHGGDSVKDLRVIVCDVCQSLLGFPQQECGKVQQAVARSTAPGAVDTLEEILKGVTRERMAPTDEEREWLDAPPVGKEILD